MNFNECSPTNRNCDVDIQAKLAGDMLGAIPADQRVAAAGGGGNPTASRRATTTINIENKNK